MCGYPDQISSFLVRQMDLTAYEIDHEQRIITGTLANLSERATQHNVQSPALLIIGEVAAFAHSLHWFGEAPLSERNHEVVINRQAA